MRLASPRSGATRSSRTDLPFGREIKQNRRFRYLRVSRPIPDWQWLLLRPEREPGSPVAALVLTTRPSGRAGLSVVDVLWDEARVSTASVLRAVARTARADGFKKLSIFTLAESRLARCLERCGFIRRHDTLPLVVHLIREDAVLPPIQDWLMTSFDGSGW